jgi:TonB family protein
MKFWKSLAVIAALSMFMSLSSLSPSSPFSMSAAVRLVQMQSIPESKIISKVQPVYPPDAADLRIHGMVKMRVVIGTDGRVESAHLISGHPLLAPAALQAVRKWVFNLSDPDGQPTRVQTEIDIPFNLDAHGRPVQPQAAPASHL